MRGKHLNSGIRGGLWEEPHLERMGPAVWLFGWLVHRQTREHSGVGLVLGGSPLTYEIIHQDTGMAVRTLKRWMARLVRAGYVRITHTARKRMIIEISKAKKFGPQQLRFPQPHDRFPQKRPRFPQTPFFAPNSKGPLPALLPGAKGPLPAPQDSPETLQATVNTDTCIPAPRCHREFESERQKDISASRPRAHFAASPDVTLRPQFLPAEANAKTARELRLRSELHIGAGPEILRE